MRLLLIDDSRLDRKVIKRLLGQIKGEPSIAEAGDVESALEMVAVEHFDCILIDYHLPGSDGVVLAGRIVESHGITMPMVMLTAEPSPALAEQALDSGLTDFMSKRNLSAEHLQQTLCNAIIKHKSKQRRAGEDRVDDSYGDTTTSEKDGLIEQALVLLSSSKSIQQCLGDDEDVQIAMDMLRKAATMQSVH